MAFEHLKSSLDLLRTNSGLFPSWQSNQKNSMFKQLQGAVAVRTLIADLTSGVIETLL